MKEENLQSLERMAANPSLSEEARAQCLNAYLAICARGRAEGLTTRIFMWIFWLSASVYLSISAWRLLYG